MTLGNLIDPATNQLITTDELTTRIKDTFRMSGNSIKLSGGKLIALPKLVAQWKRNLQSVPSRLIQTALGVTDPYPYLDSKIVMMLKSWAPSWNSRRGIPTMGRGPGRADPIPHTPTPKRKQVINDRSTRAY